MDLIRNFPLTLQLINQQSFKARGFTPSEGKSSYPQLNQVQFNTPFAVHFQDPNDDGILHYCYVPPSHSHGVSTNFSWE